jgi:hypothetical protein
MSDYGIQVITVSMPPGIMQVALIMELVKLSLGILCDDRGLKLVLVSKGGFHRAGTVAACILCALGSPPEQAIRSDTDRLCLHSQTRGAHCSSGHRSTNRRGRLCCRSSPL